MASKKLLKLQRPYPQSKFSLQHACLSATDSIYIIFTDFERGAVYTEVDRSHHSVTRMNFHSELDRSSREIHN